MAEEKQAVDRRGLVVIQGGGRDPGRGARAISRQRSIWEVNLNHPSNPNNKADSSRAAGAVEEIDDEASGKPGSIAWVRRLLARVLGPESQNSGDENSPTGKVF